MNQPWFSLGFLSKKFSLKALYISWYKGIYSRVCEKCEKSIFSKTGHSSDLASQLERVTSLSREITVRPNYTFCPVMLQLSWPFSFLHASHVWHFGDLLVASQLQDLVVRLLWMHTSWVFFALSYTQPLHNSHLNTGYLIAEITSTFGTK